MKKHLLFALCLIVMASASAATVLTTDPLVVDGNAGWSSATCGDIVVAGAPGMNAFAPFRWNGSSWVRLDEVYSPNPDPDILFARDIALSEDCKTLIACAPGDDTRGADAGIAYVFQGPGDGTFSSAGVLPNVDTVAGDEFCEAVSVNDDGTVVAVGAHHADKAYVFWRTSVGEAWSKKKLEFSGVSPGFDYLGYDVAVDGTSSDNTYVFVGAPEQWNGNSFGTVYIAERHRGGTNNWGQRHRIAGNGTQRFGWALDGNQPDGRFLVGDPLFNPIPSTAGQGQGKVYAFRLTGASYVSEGYFISTVPQADAEFGRTVSMDGSYAVITEPFSDVGGIENLGRTHLYRRSGATWMSSETYAFFGEDTFAEIGWSSDIASGTIVTGAPFDNVDGFLDTGSVRVAQHGLFLDGFESGDTSRWSATQPN